MGDYSRESRVYRERDDGGDEEDRYRSTTVRRYKVAPSRYERSSERVDVEDDRRSYYSGHAGRSSRDTLEVDRRSYAGDRPRSAFEPYADRSRSFYYERDVERDSGHRDPERSRITVYESKDSDRDNDWDRRSHRHGHSHDDEIKVETRTKEQYDDPYGHEVERYRKETQYYTQPESPKSPVVIRQRAPEPQKIIFQESQQPAPIVIPRQDPGVLVVREKESPREVVRREPRERDEEYYYRRERRDGPYRDERDWAVGRYERRRGRDRDPYSDDEDVSWSRKVVRRESSESPHHKRHLAEGALAGAGVTALMSSRRDDYGDLPEHRGRKVLAGAALGALGTEALKRAHSAYEDRYGDGRESDDRHSMLKKGLGVAAVALAAAGAAKYYQANKIDKEEAHRGRSRTRVGYHSGSDVSRSRSRTKSRRRSIAKAAVGTAAAAGIVKHFRDKSKGRSGSRGRSKSRLRKVAEIGGAAAAAGVATKMWKNHKERQESRSRGVSLSDDDRDYRKKRGSRSRSASMARSVHSDIDGDRELGLVEYGNDPLPPSERAYESEAEARRRRRRRQRDRSASFSGSDGDDRKRSRSRLRDMAAAGAAAFGIKEYKDRRDQEKRKEKSRDRDRRSRDREARERERDRRYDDEDSQYFDNRADRPQHSPPTASGGAYFPPYPATPGPGNAPAPAGGGAFTQYPDPSGEFQPYVPQDYMGYPPPPPGPPPAGAVPGPQYPPAPPGPPPAGGPIHPDQVSNSARSSPDRARAMHDDGVRSRSLSPASTRSDHVNSTPHPAKSVTFIPLSPKSSRTMEMHHQQHEEHQHIEQGAEEVSRDARGHTRQRGLSDPSSNRSIVPKTSTRSQGSSSQDSDDDVEELPPRFDSRGRPMDGQDTTRSGPRMTSRRGEFARPAQNPGDWDMRGAWQVSGTEAEVVDRLVRNVTGVLEGRGTWAGLLGDVLGGGVLRPDASDGTNRNLQDDVEDDPEEERRRRRARRRRNTRE